MGRATTYSDIAAQDRHRKAARAVGAAVGKNPVSFVVPCHRVLGKSGDLTGYHWGLTRKRAMLGWEAGTRRRRVAPASMAPAQRAVTAALIDAPAAIAQNRSNFACLRHARLADLAAVRRNWTMQRRRPVMLVILDGWGWREDAADNAVRQARTPNFDRLWASCPHRCCTPPATTSACRTGRWAIPRSAISISAPAAS